MRLSALTLYCNLKKWDSYPAEIVQKLECTVFWSEFEHNPRDVISVPILTLPFSGGKLHLSSFPEQYGGLTLI